MQRSPQSYRRPAWRLPPGVAPGTWEYTQRESIANDYSEFLKSTPLIEIDLEVTRSALPMASEQRGTRVIDFGCGDGRALEMLWQHGYDVLGIDMSQPMLACASKRPHGDELARRLLRANLVQLEGLADQIADHAICLFSTIGMIRGRVHRRSFMNHVARLLKPGGRFVLHVHNRNDAWRDRASTVAYLQSAWQSIRRRECEWGDRTYAYRGLADMFLHTYSLAELKADLKATGWQHLKIMPLSSRSDAMLPRPKLLPSLRAGGFIAIGERSPSQPHA